MVKILPFLFWLQSGSHRQPALLTESFISNCSGFTPGLFSLRTWPIPNHPVVKFHQATGSPTGGFINNLSTSTGAKFFHIFGKARVPVQLTLADLWCLKLKGNSKANRTTGRDLLSSFHQLKQHGLLRQGTRSRTTSFGLSLMMQT